MRYTRVNLMGKLPWDLSVYLFRVIFIANEASTFFEIFTACKLSQLVACYSHLPHACHVSVRALPVTVSDFSSEILQKLTCIVFRNYIFKIYPHISYIVSFVSSCSVQRYFQLTFLIF